LSRVTNERNSRRHNTRESACLGQVVVQRGHRGQRHLHVGDGQSSEDFVNLQTPAAVAVGAKEARLAQREELVQRRVLSGISSEKRTKNDERKSTRAS
jgi:hypothetical protein